MYDFSKLLWFFPKSIVYRKLRDNQTRNALFREIWYINITRLKSVLYIVALFVLLMLFLDLFSEDLWDKSAQHRYLILDSFLFLYVISVLIYLRNHRPFKAGEIKKASIFLFNLTLIICISWAALVSINEIESSDGLPSFVIICFAIAAIFLLSKWFMLLLLAIGIVTLIIGAFFLDLNLNTTIATYFPSFFLIIISFFISRILYTNFIKAFAANNELNKTNSHLDELVKKRTIELSDMNEKLEHEIEVRNQYESKLRLEKQKVEEADRLKSAFLANMSHEIRTPLNGIVGFSDLLGRPSLSEEKRTRYISIIKSNSNQLIHIIDDIIDISMIESNQLKYKYEEVQIKQIFDKSTSLYDGSNINKASSVVFKNQLINIDKNLTIYSDTNRISQVIYNLLGNAFKFTEKGYVDFIMRRDENDLLVCVEDTGIGISQEKANIIFERFRQIEDTPYRRFGGTGLGLSISKAIIQHLNGDIWLDSYYKKGARFCFSIPLVIKYPKSLEGKDNLHIKTSTTKNKKILIYIEDVDFLDYIRQIFRTERIVISHKLSKTQKDLTKSNFDLVIYGTDKPEMFDIEGLRKIKDLFSDKTVLYSIVQNPEQAQQMESVGSHKTFLLPLNLLKFVSNIKTLLEKKDTDEIT